MYKILLCEDEPDLLELLVDIIEMKLPNCQIYTAINGLDGFIWSQKENFDLIITDHKMPFMTGAAFIIGLRTRENKNKATPVIMLSGHIDSKMRQELKIQNVEFLEKPLTPDELINLTRTYLI